MGHYGRIFLCTHLQRNDTKPWSITVAEKAVWCFRRYLSDYGIISEIHLIMKIWNSFVSQLLTTESHSLTLPIITVRLTEVRSGILARFWKKNWCRTVMSWSSQPRQAMICGRALTETGAAANIFSQVLTRAWNVWAWNMWIFFTITEWTRRLPSRKLWARLQPQFSRARPST